MMNIMRRTSSYKKAPEQEQSARTVGSEENERADSGAGSQLNETISSDRKNEGGFKSYMLDDSNKNLGGFKKVDD